MGIQINKNLDKIEKQCKNKRNQLINVIIVLLCGVYCVVFEKHVMFETMGWLMIIAGVFFIFFCYMLPLLRDLFFPFRKFIYKCRKSKLHLKYKN